LTELPSVSLIVLNWNGKHHLDSCLGSLSELDYPASKLEVILCDNGSVDGSVEFVKAKFAGVKVIALDRNYGFAEGNDRAAEEASGEWVGFLNNDMWVKPAWLKDMLAALEERPDAACIASKIVNWDGSALDFVGGGVNFMGQAFQLDYGKAESPHDKFRRLLFACGGAMLVRRELFLEVGGFDPDFFAFFEDVDLGWRLNVLGYDTWYTPRAIAYHRHHGTAKRIQPSEAAGADRAQCAGHHLQVLRRRQPRRGPACGVDAAERACSPHGQAGYESLQDGERSAGFEVAAPLSPSSSVKPLTFSGKSGASSVRRAGVWLFAKRRTSRWPGSSTA